MDAKLDPRAEADARSIITTRVYDAPRELVFGAWTAQKHLSVLGKR
jgi:uncharacterized protein YndB with AHSA1/START domain